jgi:hypothetical protein
MILFVCACMCMFVYVYLCEQDWNANRVWISQDFQFLKARNPIQINTEKLGN